MISVQLIQRVNSVKCVSFKPSRASKRPTVLVYEQIEVLRYVRIHQVRHRTVFGSSSNRKDAISQCLLGDSLHIACFSSSLPRHGPFIVRSAQLFHPFNGFIQVLHPSRRSPPVTTIVFSAPPTSARFHNCALPGSSCSGVWDPRSVEYQSCKLAMLMWCKSRDWLCSNISTISRCKHLLDTEISTLNSFLDQKVP